MRVLPVQVRRLRLLTHPVRTRFPFRYGIASMVDMPHLFVSLDVEIDGQPANGNAAESLPPKWFTKNPATTFEQDLPHLVAVIRHACELAVEAGRQPSFFALWQKLYEAQTAWGATQGHPPLLSGFGTSLVERAVLDALSRHHHAPVHDVLRENGVGIDLRAVRPELAGMRLKDVLPAQPRESVAVRHTVGLGDPLDSGDVETPLADGLPHTLEENIRAYGLRWFKIKLGGNPDTDHARLARLARIITAETGGQFQFTLDGNENYRDIAAFRAAWERFAGDAEIAEFVRRGLVFVEQPLHRDHALTDDVGAALASWRGAPPMIIDEADGELASLPRALALGYAGTSHKNCKGIVKGIANAALLARRRQVSPGKLTILSGEDLATIGPVCLLQDLAMMASLGIAHVERNGHHYFRGLSQFPQPIQEHILRDHPDLYARHADGFAALRVENGAANFASILGPVFGPSHPIDLTFADELGIGHGA